MTQDQRHEDVDANRIIQLTLLQGLQTVANHQQEADSDTTGITFQPAMVWRLIDSNMAQMAVAKPASPAPDETKSTTVRVTTQFIHPVSEDQVAEATPVVVNTFSDGSDGFEHLSLDEFLLDSMTADLPWLPLYPSSFNAM